MSLFHSTMSRREFMRNLGLTGAGLGAAAALTVPVFHDLDELTSSAIGGANTKRPWWVKYVDKPTTEIDWSITQRPDERHTTQTPWVLAQYQGYDAYQAMAAQTAPEATKVLGKLGNTLRDYALASGSNDVALGYGGQQSMVRIDQQFRGPMICKTPAQLGLPKWQGTPEEASQMVRAAVAFFGARVGTAEIGAAGSNERKLIYTYNRSGSNGAPYSGANCNANMQWPPPLIVSPQIVMEDVDPGYHDGQRIHLPNKFLWDISFMIPMGKEAWRTAMPGSPSQVASGANISRYRLFSSVQPCTLEFLRGLGYWGYGAIESGKQMLPSEASAVLSGNAEMARHSDAAIDPEFGSNMGYWSMLIDLPVAPQQPVDAGIFRFCHTCHKCADLCPSSSISQDSAPTWDVPNFDYKVPNMSNNPGKKLFWTDMSKCAYYSNIYGCHVCRSVCTFNQNYKSMIHEVMKATVSETTVLNGFAYKMSKDFGYGQKNSEDWWDMSLPLLDYDSTVIAYSGGYKR